MQPLNNPRLPHPLFDSPVPAAAADPEPVPAAAADPDPEPAAAADPDPDPAQLADQRPRSRPVLGALALAGVVALAMVGVR